MTDEQDKTCIMAGGYVVETLTYSKGAWHATTRIYFRGSWLPVEALSPTLEGALMRLLGAITALGDPR